MKKTILCLFTFVTIFLTGCAASTLPDTYIGESDYQYKQWSSGIYFPKIQQGDGIVYLYHNGFIYYMEEDKEVILPLCNKADCLHDQESDIEKRKACNAYMDSSGDTRYVSQNQVGIAKCNDYIYCMNPAASLLVPQTLFRCSLDGTTKEEVYTWDSDESAIIEWMVHRDVLYYVEKRYYLKDEKVITECTVKSLALTGVNRQPETIYTADEDLLVLSIGTLNGYGNHVYFMIVSQWADEEPAPEDDPYRNLYQKTFVYDTQNGEVNELAIPGMSKNTVILGVQFWQDKIIMDPFIMDLEENAPVSVYIADLDGSNAEVLLEDVPQTSYFLSDGEYLYLFEDYMPDIDDWLANPGTYTVYDKDLNVVDTLKAPVMQKGKPIRFPVGEKNNMYFVYENEENDTWGVMHWDKDSIGGYQGDTFSMTKIPYQQ